jgi:TATA-box binding protein (TBP) (component of TFIID and TFIIIB)
MKNFRGALYDDWEPPTRRLKTTYVADEDTQCPSVANVVSTVRLLNKSINGDFRLPLATIASKLPIVQYTPRAFSSVIARFKDGKDSFTMLLFSSGKCVIVKCQSPAHSLYTSQRMRLLLSDIDILIKDPQTQEIRTEKLGKYIGFYDWRVQNIVLSADLGFQVKLEELASFAPEKIKYNPDGFPGAQCEVQVRQKCTCSDTYKCGCKATVVIFDSGSVIIAGVKSVQEGTVVYRRFARVVGEFEEEDNFQLSKEDRNRSRIRRLAEYLAPAVAAQQHHQQQQQQPQNHEAALLDVIEDAVKILNQSSEPFRLLKLIKHVEQNKLKVK